MRRNASTQPGYYRVVVEAALDAVLPLAKKRSAPALIGVSGLQGSGKSTLARQLAGEARRRGVRTEILALDDFYLGRRERAALARDVHALLATRGVPGTHDLALLDRTMRALRHASIAEPATIPRFDKGRDTRVAPSRWRRVVMPPKLILLEGWCVGIPAQESGALARSINVLERNEDVHGRWRAWVNAQLANDYARLWRSLDALIVLAAPDFSIVERWRGEPERALRRRGAPAAMSPSSLRRFLLHYERLSRHALRTLPQLADVLITLDAKRKPRRVRVGKLKR